MLEVIVLVSLIVISINGLCEFLGVLGKPEEKSAKRICSEENYYTHS